MRPLDLAVLVAFLVYLVWSGIRQAKHAGTPEGFFLAGRRMRWWAIGISVMATQASAITMLSITGHGFDHGMHWIHVYYALPFAMVILCLTVVPWFTHARVVTAYEYLESRFDRPTRLVASALFLLSRALAVGTSILAPSIVLTSSFGIPTWLSILLIGTLSTAYTVAGGAGAVIATDLKQMTIMIVGIIACIVVALARLPEGVGFGDALALAGASGKLEAVRVTTDWKRILSEDYNLVSALVAGLFLFLGYFGADQSQVQRYLAGATPEQSKQSLLVSAFAKVPMQFVILLLGALLFVHYTFRPAPACFREPELERALATLPADEGRASRAEFEEIKTRFAAASERREDAANGFLAARRSGAELDEAVARVRAGNQEVQSVRGEAVKLVGRVSGKSSTDSDSLFTFFVLKELPVGLAGLVLAAIFAAAISSLDAQLSSLATSTVVDLWVPSRLRAMPGKRLVAISRLLTFFWGLFATVAAYVFFVQGVGAIIVLVNKIGSLVYGSLFGIFILGWLVPRARGSIGWMSLGAGVLGVVATEAFNRVHEKAPFLEGFPARPIGFLWYNLIGFLGVMIVGTFATWVATQRDRAQRDRSN